jgi:hypothetical protein
MSSEKTFERDRSPLFESDEREVSLLVSSESSNVALFCNSLLLLAATVDDVDAVATAVDELEATSMFVDDAVLLVVAVESKVVVVVGSQRPRKRVGGPSTVVFSVRFESDSATATSFSIFRARSASLIDERVAVALMTLLFGTKSELELDE